MDAEAGREQRKAILVGSLTFDARRTAGFRLDPSRPRGEGSLGFDFLDVVEISRRLENRFCRLIDEGNAPTSHLESLGALVGDMTSRIGPA